MTITLNCKTEKTSTLIDLKVICKGRILAQISKGLKLKLNAKNITKKIIS